MTDSIRITDLRAWDAQRHGDMVHEHHNCGICALTDVAEAANAFLDATDAHDQAIAIKGVFGEQLEDRTTETEQARSAAYKRLDHALARFDWETEPST